MLSLITTETEKSLNFLPPFYSIHGGVAELFKWNNY